jgi:hypothetical protein
MEGTLKSIADAIDVEVGARAILLDDLRQSQLRRFVRRKSFLACKATPAAANRIACLRNPRVDDLGFRASTKGAFHRLSRIAADPDS